MQISVTPLPFPNRKSQALTLVEILVVIAALAVLVVLLLLPALASAHRRAARFNCSNNLEIVGSSFGIWEEDNHNEFPMSVSVTNGGGMELIATGNVAGFFLVMSNELSTPKILVCPADTNVVYATNQFGSPYPPDFSNKNISYFVGIDADTNNPQRLLCGDDNFESHGITVPSGVFQLSTNSPIAWTDRHDDTPHIYFPRRHNFLGNIVYADGSVTEVSSLGLQQSLVQSGIATNRLAIP